MGYRSMHEVMNLINKKDLEGAKACFHEEFMYLRELEMLTIDDVLDHFEEFTGGKLASNNRITWHDDEHSANFSHDITYGEKVRGMVAGLIVGVRLAILKKMV